MPSDTQIKPGTLRELWTYNDWGNEKLLGSAEKLNDEKLDWPFEMGEGSLRGTLFHLAGAERVWLDRWNNGIDPKSFDEANGIAIPALREKFRATAAERNALLTRDAAVSLERPITYTNWLGKTYTFALGEMMLHVCNHGTHHRAQAVNMMRHVGAELPKPGPDYIFMKLHQQQDPAALPAPAAPAELDVGTIRAYFAFADWARERVHNIAARLTDAQLDRVFEMGLGTLRKTLLHIRVAEQWWLENWTRGTGAFPELSDKTTLAELATMAGETAHQRNEILAGLTDADLSREIEARPRPDVKRVFPLGVTMLQLCNHGTHHRAQALNMLRHSGAEVPCLDYLEMVREQQKVA